MENFTLVAQAIDRGDYQEAFTLLKSILQDTPEDPWAKFYLGRLQEAQHRLRAAEEIYRQILKETPQVKLIHLARQGIQRIQRQEERERQEAIDAAMATEGQTAMGCLILKPMNSEQKLKGVAEFARLMHLDPYIARLHLPSRIWRLYRTGSIGELEVYQRELERIGIPAFCLTLNTIAAVKVWRMDSMIVSADEIIVQGKDSQDQPQTMNLVPGAIERWVEGLLPIFEQVVEQGPWRKVIRKEKTQDYAHIIDFHSPCHHLILRLCDRSYQFSPPKQLKTNSFTAQQTSHLVTSHLVTNHLVTHHQQWNEVLQKLRSSLGHLKAQNTFAPFAEANFDQSLFLQRITPHIDVLRAEETLWDNAFHLYSILHWFIPT